MKTTIALASPDDAEMTVAITQPLRAWRRLLEEIPDLQDPYAPAARLRAAIHDVVRQATRHFAVDDPPAL